MTIEEEMELARREGVVRPENMPFLLEPEKPRGVGVLLVHGFTASPWEMRRLGEALAKNGYTAMGVRLPGHGTSPEDLASRDCEEWLQTVERGFHLLANRHPRIYCAGMSTGGLLLLSLAPSLPARALVLLSPFLRFQNRLAGFAWLLRHFKDFQERPLPPELSPYYYQRRPLEGIHQVFRLISRARRNLARITVPTLVVSAEGDRTVQVRSALEIFREIPSGRKEFHLYGPTVPHVLTTPENPRRDETFHLILDFFNRLEENRGENP
jgi:carboxylesterase